MSKYVTRQRKVLLDCLNRHPDETFSAQEIAGMLGEESVSLSSVYRNLAELEAEGKVRRTLKGSVRESYYQFLDGARCKNRLHLTCTQCGKTAHMDAEEARELTRSVAKRDGFLLDKTETILYGVCEVCQHAGPPEKSEETP